MNPPEEPSLTQMAENFTSEMLKWANAGFKIVPKTVYEFRIGCCKQCEYWDDKARLGYGKCNAPGCGCGRGKQWLLTSKCPLNRWEDQIPKLP